MNGITATAVGFFDTLTAYFMGMGFSNIIAMIFSGVVIGLILIGAYIVLRKLWVSLKNLWTNRGRSAFQSARNKVTQTISPNTQLAQQVS